MISVRPWLAVCCLLLLPTLAIAQDTAEEKEKEAQAAKLAAEQTERFKMLEQTLTNAKLTGQFTVLGRDTEPKQEEYSIRSAKKLPEGDYWMLNARIKYGDKDVTVPLPLEIKWAGDTPVITLTNFSIPGMGTFSSRVIIYNGKYAGTWTHGKVGGHLFGTIESLEAKKGEDAGEKAGDDAGKEAGKPADK